MSRRIRVIELQEAVAEDMCACLDGCEERLEDLLNVVERLVVERLAGEEPGVEELEEVYYAALDLYKCVVGEDIPEGGEEWS